MEFRKRTILFCCSSLLNEPMVPSLSLFYRKIMILSLLSFQEWRLYGCPWLLLLKSHMRWERERQTIKKEVDSEKKRCNIVSPLDPLLELLPSVDLFFLSTCWFYRSLSQWVLQNHTTFILSLFRCCFVSMKNLFFYTALVIYHQLLFPASPSSTIINIYRNHEWGENLLAFYTSPLSHSLPKPWSLVPMISCLYPFKILSSSSFSSLGSSRFKTIFLPNHCFLFWDVILQ